MAEETVTLKEHLEAEITANRAYFERLFAERDRQVTEQAKALAVSVEDKRQALALAVEKQEKAYDIRFANVNEWRQTFGDLVSKGATREYVDARLAEQDRRLAAIETKQAAIAAAIADINGLKEAVADLKQWQSRINGQFAVWAVVLTLLSAVIAILARFINLGG
jgi:hypothetical protein